MNQKDLRERKFSEETLFEGRIITVQKWRVKLPDGREADREVVLHKGAAAIVPVDAERKVTLVRQHRVVVDEMMLEIPAGKLDEVGEDPFECAKRELREETGLIAKNWRLMTRVITTPGFCSEKISLYLATDLSQGENHLDEDEFLNTLKMPLSEAISLVMQGKITDAKSCMALLMADKLLQAEETGTPRQYAGPSLDAPQAKG